MKKTTLLSSIMAVAVLGLSHISLAAPTSADSDSPYNLSTTPASTAWQATPIVGDATAAATTTEMAPTDSSRVRPIAGVSGKSRGTGKNVGGEAIITMNNDTPEGNVQLFGEIKGGVSATRTR